MIVLVPLLPFATVNGLGAAFRLKSPKGTTVSAIVVVAVRPSSVPVILMVNVPVVAVMLTVNANVLLLIAGFGLSDAVTPLGRPDTERLTGLFWGAIRIVLAPVSPCVMLTLFGVAVSVSPGFTVSLSVVVCVRVPEVPVIVRVEVPVAAVALAVAVRVLVEVAGFGLKEAVIPLGSPDTASVTAAANPFSAVIVTLLVPLAS